MTSKVDIDPGQPTQFRISNFVSNRTISVPYIAAPTFITHAIFFSSGDQDAARRQATDPDSNSGSPTGPPFSTRRLEVGGAVSVGMDGVAEGCVVFAHFPVAAQYVLGIL